jgi:hypothetical protein
MRTAYENATVAAAVRLTVPRADSPVDKVSTEVGDPAVSAGGASRPHSHFDEPREGSVEVFESVSQQE